MPAIRLHCAAAAAVLLLLVSPARAAGPILDPGLVAEIASIRAIDNHAHPLRARVAGAGDDDEYDAITFEEMEPPTGLPPVRIRSDNRQYIGAWKRLYGYPHDDMSPAHVQELLATKQATMRRLDIAYPAWVLDQLGIDTMVANRTRMGPGLVAPRFAWVAYDDALIFPLSNEGARRANPDRHSFFLGEDRLRARYLSESGNKTLPATLDEYLQHVVAPTLQRQQHDAAIAIKFEAAYLRTLDFAPADRDAAARTYARYAGGGEPPADEYKVLQDFLFREVARQAGQLGLAVHIHCTGGVGSYYSLRGANPLLLESSFNDPTLRKTNFVLIHGGWPYIKETAFLLGKPNVYADFSAQTFLLYPRALAETIRTWLEFHPEKVLFGTDAEPFSPQIGWEETGWLTTTTSRDALAIALTGMLEDGEIDRARAVQLAHAVMRDNALALYPRLATRAAAVGK